jgi:hypothetical protein
MFFLSLAYFVIENLKLVQAKFKRAIANNSRNEFHIAIEFHKMLICSGEKLSRLFGTFLMGRNFVTAFAVCLQVLLFKLVIFIKIRLVLIT